MHPYFEHKVYDNQRSIIYHPRTLEPRLLGKWMGGKYQKEEKTMTREEAIRILASSCIPGSKQTEALETLIPGLRESEDEWIRKFLVDFFASYKIGDAETKLNGVRIDDILAYLEKQKDILGERAKNITANMLEDRIGGIQRELIEFLSNTVNASWVDIIQSADAYAERIRNIIEKQKEQKPEESISQLTVQGKGVYKICPRCKERMVRDDSMVYTSMPPQYRYECPKCGESECDTVMYDNPEMKEQKPSINIDQLKSLMLQYLQEAANEKDDLDIEADTDKWARKILGYDFEQKPVDLSEMMVHKEPYIAPVPTPMVADGHKLSATKNGKTIPPENYSVNIPLAEWSEEDKRAIDRACVALRAYANGDLPEFLPSELIGYADRLQSLRPQPKQEWSEEDRLHYVNVLEALEYVKGCKFDYDKIEAVKSDIAWFKSLKPSWKPSEAQLMALHSMIDDKSDTIGNEQLKLLYSDLNKL